MEDTTVTKTVNKMVNETVSNERPNIEELIALEFGERFNKPWSKLDKGTKLNRLHLFIKKEKISKNLDDSHETQLKTLITNRFEKSELNKMSDISYCQENKEIITIKNLTYDENKRKYQFSHGPNKKKKTDGGKSKSNIDRHFSRSKGNKTNL